MTGVDALLDEEVGDTVGDDAGLAGAGPGEDEEGALSALDGLPLTGVEGREDGGSRGSGHATRMIQVFEWTGQ